MKKIAFLILFSAVFLPFMAWKGGEKKEKEPVTRILIHTDLGDMKVLLYNETPKHRDNFIKLVKEGTLNGTLFHRVIQGFMIQGGDVESKNPKPGVPLGNGNVGYTIPAEFNPKLFHKKGALAGARESDEVNPKKESSGCQFYIVQGQVFTDTLLNMQEFQLKRGMMQQVFNEYANRRENAAFLSKFMRLQNEHKSDSMNILFSQVQPVIEKEVDQHFVKFTDEQRKAYKTMGGVPHLDGSYTVFGEVYEGLDVIDKIAQVEKDQYDRPKTDIHMTMSFIKK